ncbi:MAG: hypothetical protein ABIO94_01710 [Opitutaceae bacterium]
MKHDHTFTFTAAVVLAGVVLAFVNPAEAINSTAPVASSIENSISAPAKSPAKHKGDCERVSRLDPRA